MPPSPSPVSIFLDPLLTSAPELQVEPCVSRDDAPRAVTVSDTFDEREGEGREHVGHVVGTRRHNYFCAGLRHMYNSNM